MARLVLLNDSPSSLFITIIITIIIVPSVFVSSLKPFRATAWWLTMPLFEHRMLTLCPECGVIVQKVAIYIHLELEVYLVIYIHENPDGSNRLCCRARVD